MITFLLFSFSLLLCLRIAASPRTRAFVEQHLSCAMNILTTGLMGTNKKFIEPDFQYIARSVPDHCNKVGISMK